MVKIPEIWSTYQKYCHHTRSTLNIPEIWSKYQNFGQHTRNMVNYQKYGRHTRNMVNIRQMKKEKVKYLDKKYKKA